MDPAFAGTLAIWVQKAIPVAAQYGGAGVATVLIIILVVLKLKAAKGEPPPPPVSDGETSADKALPSALPTTGEPGGGKTGGMG